MRNILYTIFFIEILLFVIPHDSYATKSLHPAKTIDLSNNAVICMHQDPSGYLWFGTYDGLNLYNGKQTYVYRFELNNKNSLCSNIINNITDANPGYIWVSTSLGLNKFSLKERKVVESYPGYNECELIASDTTGITLAVAKDNMISCYFPYSNGFKDIPTNNITAKNVVSIFTSPTNHFYMLLSSGCIKKLNPDFSQTSFNITSEERQFHNSPIVSAFQSDNLIYFVDSNEKLYRQEIEGEQKEKLADLSGFIKKNGYIVKIFTFQSNTYIMFRNGLLLNVTEEKNSFMVGASIFSLMLDKRQEIIWIGTDGQGVKMIYQKPDLFGTFLFNELPIKIQNPVRAIYTEKDGTLWFGTKGSGIVRIKEYEKYQNQNKIPLEAVTHYTTENGLPCNRIYFFKRSQFHPIIWIGTEGEGLSYYSYKEEKIKTIQPPCNHNPIQFVHSIVEVNDSTLWLATTGKGLQKVSLNLLAGNIEIKETKNFYPQKGNIICNEIQSMIYDNDSTLFLGSRGGYGVISFNIFSHEYEFWQISNSKNTAIGDVLSICLTEDSTFYIGASSGFSCVKFQKEKMLLRQFYEKSGMSNDMIHGILPGNDSCIWLSTNKGLTKFNPQNHFFHNYRKLYLKVTEFSDDAYWKCPYTNRLFFGGINGLAWVNKQAEPENVYKPSLHFFEVQIDNDKAPLNEEITKQGIIVPANAQTLSVSFVAPDYINGENYEYSYQLENFNSSWISLEKTNKVSFVKLPHGKYRLKVRYHNDVTNSSAKEYILPIHVLPPFYLSSIAIVGYLLLGIIILVSIIFRIHLQLKRKQRQITRKIKEEQKEKLYEAKLNFFTHITHELCTPLTLIKGVEYYISTFAKAAENKTLQKYTSVLHTNIEELNSLIQEILDFRKAEDSGFSHTNIQKISVSTLINSQCERFTPIAERENIQFETAIPKELIWNTDPVFLKKIVANLISNAFKYTNKGGTIRVSLVDETNKLIFKVYNTGKGIQKSEIKTIFDRYRILSSMESEEKTRSTVSNGLGLYISHCLVENLGGKIFVESEVDKYAEFTVILPNEKLNVISSTDIQKESILSIATEALPEMIKPKTIENKAKEETKKKPTVLVVDDHKDIVWLIGETLKDTFLVEKTFNAEDAITFLKKHTPALIITDIILPRMNGLELISLIKKNKYTSHIPLIIISAKTSDKEQAIGLNTGADAYLSKPFSQTVLKSVVNRLMTNQKELKQYFYSPESAFQYTEGQLLHQEDKEFMDTVTAIVKENIGKEGLGPELIAETLHINTRTLYRRFKKISSTTPSDFIKDYRLNYAAKLLINTNLSVQEIIYNVGISNKSYFYKEFARKFDMTPKEYRTNGINQS